jgi:hypothetical protein
MPGSTVRERGFFRPIAIAYCEIAGAGVVRK